MTSQDSEANADIKLSNRSINMIFDHVINDLHLKPLKIGEENNLSWDIGIDDLFKTKAELPHLGIGSVRDRCGFLTDMMQESTSTDDAPALMLMHATALLNFVSHVVRA